MCASWSTYLQTTAGISPIPRGCVIVVEAVKTFLRLCALAAISAVSTCYMPYVRALLKDPGVNLQNVPVLRKRGRKPKTACAVLQANKKQTKSVIKTLAKKAKRSQPNEAQLYAPCIQC